MDDLPTMRTSARRQEHYGVEMDPNCLICHVSEEEGGHMWECPATIKEANKEVKRLRECLERNFYAGGDRERKVTKTLADPLTLVHMAAALQTKTMKKDKLLTTSRTSVGTQFISQVLSASQRLWTKHCNARAAAIRARKGEGWDMADLMEEVQYQSILESQGVPEQEAPKRRRNKRGRMDRV